MFVIGITGSLASGKSVVANMLARKGAKVLNADKMAHALIDQGGACHKAVIRLFGKGILLNGRVDRKKVAEIVFSHPKMLKKLERIVHPAVKRCFEKEIRNLKKSQKNKLIVLDVPLLFESGIDRLTDVTITVKALRKQQINRSVRRLGITRQQALNRIKSQMPLQEKIYRADIIIDNTQSLKQTQKQVNTLWLKLQQKIKK